MSPTETAKMKDFGLAIGPGELGKEVFMNLKADLTIADESIRELIPKKFPCIEYVAVVHSLFII